MHSIEVLGVRFLKSSLENSRALRMTWMPQVLIAKQGKNSVCLEGLPTLVGLAKGPVFAIPVVFFLLFSI